MDIVVNGRSVGDYVVVVNGEQYVIKDLVEIVEDKLAEQLAEAASIEYFFSQLYIEANKELRDFEDTTYAQYQAHIDQHARYYLKGIGTKNPTVADKHNAAVLMFSEGANQELFKIAHIGYVQECKSVNITPMSLEEFIENALAWGVSYEKAVTDVNAMRYKVESLQAISKAFVARTWALKTLAADKRAAMAIGV
jgi:hypothetical protein